MYPGQNANGGMAENNFSGAPIIISDPTPLNNGKKSKKWVWILVAFVLVAVAGGIIALWQSGTFKSVNNAELVNKYVNLLASNNDSEEGYDGELIANHLINNSDNNSQNIYTLPRLFSYDDDKNLTYYHALTDTLGTIVSVNSSRSGQEEVVSLSKSTKKSLSEYFVATFLAETDASYYYFVKYGNIDGFLSEYDYPFDYSGETTVGLINNLYYLKKEMYKEISETGCTSSGEIDYECLDAVDNKKIKTLQSDTATLSIEVKKTAPELLRTIVSDANQLLKMTRE